MFLLFVVRIGILLCNYDIIPFEKWQDTPYMADQNTNMPFANKEALLGNVFGGIANDLTAKRLSMSNKPGFFSDTAINNQVSVEEIENAGIKLEASRRVAEAAAKIAQNEAEKIKMFSEVLTPVNQ